ncbi:hypothetical protein A2454_07090 [Candidatus Peribacteria bacterium RIFOXYC2_FULL_55_14]|nr:MAG: hypothetical protein A2454_07090 [Candidatus Peribacteria bacterium RIFOXYC2_FULL_55_14]
MHTNRSHSGHSPSERERRLCRVTAAEQPGDLERFGGMIGRGMKDFLDDMVHRFRDAIGTNAQTMANMRSEKTWIEAFNLPDIFTAQRYRLNPQQEFGPRQVLLDMEPELRKQEFVRFMRELIPDDIREEYGHIFEDPAFQTFSDPNHTFDQYLDATRGEPINITERQMDIMLTVQKMLIGKEVREDSRDIYDNASNIARSVLIRRYREREDNLAVAMEDYKQAVKSLGNNADRNIIENADLLVDRLPPSRFKAALRLGVLTNRDLRERLAPMARAQEEEEKAQSHQSAEEMNKLNKREVQEQIRQRNRTFVDNFHNMSGKEKFFAVALASFVTYKMLKSESWLVRGIPITIGGVYLYRRLIVGDKQPLNTMGKFTQDFVGFAGKPIRAGLEKVGILAPQSDIQALSVMQDFLKEQNLSIYPIAQSFAALAQVRMDSIATGLSIVPRTGAMSLNASEGTNLNREISEVSRRYGIDRSLALKGIQENNEEVSGAMAHVMYLLGAKERPDVAQRLENAKEAAMDKNIVVRTPQDFRNIPGGMTSFNEYMNLVMLGRDSARRKYGNRSFLEIIQEFESKKPEAAEPRFDNADSIDDKPLDTENRKKERTLLSSLGEYELSLTSREEITKEDGLLDLEILESIGNMQTLGLIDESASDVLKVKFRTIRENKSLPLHELLTAAERLKYAILVSTLDAEQLPLNGDKIDRLTQGKDSKTILGSILSFFQRATSLSSNFGEIETLGNVDAILAQRLAGKVRSNNETGFTALRERIGTYQRFFSLLRTSDKLNPSLRAKIDGALGDQSEAFLKQIFGLPDKDKRIANMEQYLAQRMANAIVLAMLTEHRASGIHTLITDPKERIITPNEENNLLREFDQLFAFTINYIGTNQRNRGAGEEGAFEMADILDNAIKFENLPEGIPALRSETYKEGLTNLTKIARAWFILWENETDPDRKRVLEERLDAIQKKIEEHVEELAKEKIWLQPPKPGNPGHGYELAKLMIQLMKLRGKDHKLLSSHLKNPVPDSITPIPAATTPVPEATTTPPSATTPVPEATTTPPGTTTPVPEATTTPPSATTPVPEATTIPPSATTPVPEATTIPPSATTPVPEATTIPPSATTPVPDVVTPTPGAVTPIPDIVTPTPGAVTPVPEEVTPPAGTVTPVPETVTPAPGAVTPAPDIVTPGPVTPVPDVVTPTPGAVTPVPDMVTPTPGAVTPVPDIVTPTPGAVTPVPDIVTPTPGAVTPVPEEVTPPAGTVTPVPETVTPAPPATTPVPDVVTPAPGTVTPVPGETTEVPGGTTPIPGEPALTPAPEVTDIPSLLEKLKSGQDAFGEPHRIEFRESTTTPGHIEYGLNLNSSNVQPSLIASSPATRLSTLSAEQIHQLYFKWMENKGRRSGRTDPLP